MDNLIALLTPLEMLLVNLIFIDRCLQKRYSRLLTYALMGLFSVVLLLASFLLIRHTPGYGSGNGLFIFFGFLFAIPFRFLYNTSVAQIVCIACTSWVYTFFLFSISVHTSYIIPYFPLHYNVLIVQTGLYIVTLFWFYRLLRYKLLPLLSQLTRRETLGLMWLSIVWFWTAFVINLAFIYTQIYWLRVVAIFSVAVCAFTLYRYIYQVIHSERTIKKLEKIAYRDDLTQLRSRVLLTNDAEELIERQLPFSLVFIDLNNFKSVNDTYGHMVGDEYLAFFANEAKKRLGNRGGFYRVAGDEFACLYTGENVAEFTGRLGDIPATLPGKPVRYLGASYGVALYPQDGDTLDKLLNTADTRMYQMKKSDALIG